MDTHCVAGSGECYVCAEELVLSAVRGASPLSHGALGGPRSKSGFRSRRAYWLLHTSEQESKRRKGHFQISP